MEQATVKVQDALVMSDMLSLAIKNREGPRQYGVLQSQIVDMPASPTQQVVCTDGSGITAATTGELLVVDVDVLRYVIVFAFQSHQKRSNHQETGGNRKSFVL